MAKPRCICGCGKPGHNGHHVITQSVIKRHIPKGEQRRWLRDDRNIVPMDYGCHARHHSANRRLWLEDLPDSVFEFAVELMGAGPAYEYLRRYYRGDDGRLDALLAEA